MTWTCANRTFFGAAVAFRARSSRARTATAWNGGASSSGRSWSATFRSLVIRQLQPWQANIGKLLVKAPKVYIVDSGLLHGLLNLPRQADVEGHPKSGASWEGFVIEKVSAYLRAEPEERFFWATHAGARNSTCWW